jgi:hypothetical protein
MRGRDSSVKLAKKKEGKKWVISRAKAKDGKDVAASGPQVKVSPFALMRLLVALTAAAGRLGPSPLEMKTVAGVCKYLSFLYLCIVCTHPSPHQIHTSASLAP